MLVAACRIRHITIHWLSLLDGFCWSITNSYESPQRCTRRLAAVPLCQLQRSRGESKIKEKIASKFPPADIAAARSVFRVEVQRLGFRDRFWTVILKIWLCVGSFVNDRNSYIEITSGLL